jgi:Ca2+/Na+ antiporter
LSIKKYRYVVYLSELLCAVSIDLKENISSNPGCEWQLKYTTLENKAFYFLFPNRFVVIFQYTLVSVLSTVANKAILK